MAIKNWLIAMVPALWLVACEEDPDTKSQNTFTFNSKVYAAEAIRCDVRSSYYLIQASIGLPSESRYSFCDVKFFGSNSTLPVAGTYKVVAGATPPNTLPLSDEVVITIAVVETKNTGAEEGQSGTLTVTYVNNRPVLDFTAVVVKNSGNNLSSTASGHFGCQ
ncbi:hypothetical protein KK083_07455 [Fulvivirgaceae bacterium PWU4]|uniref:Uncharacterized protein n=1 Tax=Chryseosolibacter histidini TaxID=2782349 RepID=A0AAP2DME8_9BACT|nr:hypothetical protein [Chryseosolibacter histidini]MBT1696704.1 hypothetical protein [Chryseosolibacter histidini]